MFFELHCLRARAHQKHAAKRVLLARGEGNNSRYTNRPCGIAGLPSSTICYMIELLGNQKEQMLVTILVKAW